MNDIIDQIKAPTKEQFEAVYKFTQTLHSLIYQDALIEEALDQVVKAIDAERGLFARYNNVNNDFTIIAARNIKQETITSLNEFSSGILKEVLNSKKPIMYHDVQQQPDLSKFESVRISGIKSVIGVPVFHEKEIWGIIIADSQKFREKFTKQNLVMLELFSRLISIALDRIIEIELLRLEKISLENQLEENVNLPDMIGESKPMKDLAKLIHRVAKTDATVLITGESGTGKDLVARAIHKLSKRKDKPYLAQFCGSIPDNLLESELFGYKKGAFTGANSDKKGLLEVANEGTFFLDEIADISTALQTKLLRVIENQEIIRLGDTQVKKINVRIITATNKNLSDLVKKGEFREDLYYRLNVFPVRIPTLRERQGDIPLLAEYYIKRIGEGNISIDSAAMKKLEQHHWPGNVRQLINVIQRALIFAENGKIGTDAIELDETHNENIYTGTLDEITKNIVVKRIEEFGGNKTLAAESLGVSRKWIYIKLAEIEKKKNG
ncbi:MAG: sigma-54-dependent Fis family transcriptional regulator [Melioribacteraceae bacterium]|nr:sigma-54-dependent Fis family transcriptional regulator [Melioribacteraceae bacterium]MCF8356008.1 sigma-54-dependent Fis family transcriptional regulator [Melioribacteraceae bacterium]MCF8394681.1 sigma-54-dependent Fis family transcriptional regulator [Melioribacteraceae bacterium]MCF8420241.1 sigma-54-dependent Fis family transcriptional regulator [Melioribacteraceae bacterium]